jgi:hypothetical protein
MNAETPAAESARLNKADEDLLDYFKNLERNSLDAIENAARQVITLVTTLLGLFFGILAFKDNPTYLSLGSIKLFGALSAGLFIMALFFALDVVIPRRFDIPAADITAMQKLLLGLFERKSRSLQWAQLAFGVGTLCLLVVILLLIFRV